MRLGRSRLFGAAVALGLGSFGPVLAAGSAPAVPVLGRWMTRSGDGVFQIDRCGALLCGRLVGMRYSGSMPLDSSGHPQCNLLLLHGFMPTDEDGHWHGTIEDPDNGRSYQATIWSPRVEVLELRGYILLPILGETQTWNRYRGSIGAACRLPD